MGSNMAENHPIAFRFVMQAKERGATVIHVDPRFTRTSALADIYAPMRAGSDIAFLGGHHQLHPRARSVVQGIRARLHQPRRRSSTSASGTPSELDGLFSGWDEESRSYKYDILAVPGRGRAVVAGRALRQYHRIVQRED